MVVATTLVAEFVTSRVKVPPVAVVEMAVVNSFWIVRLGFVSVEVPKLKLKYWLPDMTQGEAEVPSPETVTSLASSTGRA